MKMISDHEFILMTRVAPSQFDSALFQAKLEIGQYAVEFFQKSWDQQKVPGSTARSWAVRLKPYPWSIMNKTGTLKGSIRYELKQDYGICVSTDVPYSQFHNDGIDDSGTPYRKNQHTDDPIEIRHFMGNSNLLERWIERRIGLIFNNVNIL